MAATDILPDVLSAEPTPDTVERGIPSAFEKLITDQPPVLRSLIAQLPTQSILALFHTSSYLNNFFKNSPTSWRHMSWRLYQPALTTATPTNNASGTGPRQSSNYALDQLLLYVINPFSTRLVSLELDNTAVSGATLFQTVMILRKDTLEHLSVRGCKNVSLKYHINPWLMMHAMAMDRPQDGRAPGYGNLALKSLYTYRSRHHRRRPYLPSSLARKESDSEPTHELVLTCHKLGIWTDTAWCTTPGARCFRRRGYLTTRHTPDQRDVWVVYDRLWRSRNWLGPVPVPENRSQTSSETTGRKRKRDGRSWEFDEDAMYGESVAIKGDGKTVPSHLRKTYKQFVDDVYCDNCSDPILERCEQCSVMMHCVGCRKTLCASCAFDRPYLRNKMAPAEDRNKYWWAPGCAVSPCSMLDQDLVAGSNPGTQNNASQPPSMKFRWCCMEPIFSGGGGITFGSGTSRDMDRMRAAPLPAGNGWEDEEFSHHAVCSSHALTTGPNDEIGAPLTRSDAATDLAGRWPSIDSLFQQDPSGEAEQVPSNIPRNLCDECYQSEQWRIKCKACSVPLCLKHDVGDRLKARICGYKDLTTEKAEFRSRQKALKLLAVMMLKRRQNKMKASGGKPVQLERSASTGEFVDRMTRVFGDVVQEIHGNEMQTQASTRTVRLPNPIDHVELNLIRGNLRTPISDAETSNRPLSPGSNSSEPSSRASSPTPSSRSLSDTLEQNGTSQKSGRSDAQRSRWRGCQSFFCPPSRVPGDHRRRCLASLRQCAECKIHVCEQCVGGLEQPCPCTGCRLPNEEGQHAGLSDTTLRFFCPNCRWSRMLNGKCKRKPTSANGKSSAKKKKKNKRRQRKPIEERQGYRGGSVPTASDDLTKDVVDGLVEFFESLQVDEVPESTSQPANIVAEDNGASTSEEIRELEDMGALARDLIRRIQVLRQQFGPNSLAALTLPNIRMEVSEAMQQQVQAQPEVGNVAPSEDASHEPQVQAGNDDAEASSSASGTV